MITGELKSQVDKIWDVFASGGVANPISVIEQFTFLLFIRRLDERQLKEEANANLLGTEMEVEIFTPEQKALRWHSFKNVDPQTMHKAGLLHHNIYSLVIQDQNNTTCHHHLSFEF
ncbi:type I restriction-modification system subunit M N-terminal domain-containing protein [Crocinitomicaceae bacterium]|nr:type I restriction-modification system subunit M N-terminal domain-containing protein [Crocinitomicaceae bacterium]